MLNIVNLSHPTSTFPTTFKTAEVKPSLKKPHIHPGPSLSLFTLLFVILLLFFIINFIIFSTSWCPLCKVLEGKLRSVIWSYIKNTDLTDSTFDPCAVPSPVIVSITKCSNRDGKRLPNRVQIILDHLSLVADGEPKNTKRQLNMVTTKKSQNVNFLSKKHKNLENG